VFYRRSVDRLSGLDASFLYFETSAHLMHVCGLIVLDPATVPGGYDFESMRATIAERTRNTPTFRRKVHDHVLNLDHPVWVDDADFDIEHHVRRIAVPTPGGREQLAQVCADIAGQPLDRSRPLWEFWVIEALADGQIAVMTKMHHAMVDGVTGATLVASLCSLAPDAPPLAAPAPFEPPHPPRDRDIVLEGLTRWLRRPLRLPALLPQTAAVIPSWVSRTRRGAAMPAPFTAPRTSFNGTITGHRRVAFTRLDLAAVKEVKNAFGTTVNDVVLALCSGALRRYLQQNGELPETSLVAMVPVSVHEKSDREGVNRVSGMFTTLASDIADPVERLRAIAAQTVVAKEHHNTISASMLQDWAQFAPANTLGLAVRLAAHTRLMDRAPVIHNLVISNVPGPPVPMYFAGAEVVGFYPFGPVFHGAGLNITVVSNNGHLDVGVIACRELAPRLWDLADDFAPALQELLTAARAQADDQPPMRTQPATPA
jgi:WS/DGAT/MGAT family acyltransferase